MKTQEEIRKQLHDYYVRNKDTIIERSRIYSLNNPGKVKGYKQKHARENAKEIKTKKRDWTLRRDFGIGLQDYSILLNSQNGVCAICGGENNGKTLPVDHNHTTGKVRGILCDGCNLFLGLMNDDEEIIESAIEYLRKHEK